MNKILEDLENYVLLAVIFLLPLAFTNLFTNSFEFPKLLVLVFGLGLAIIAKAIVTVRKGELKLASSPIDFPLLLLALAYIVSAIVRTPNKMEAFMIPGTATIVISSVLLYFLVNASNAKEKLGRVLVFSGALVSLISVLAFFNVFSAIPQLPQILKNAQFTTLEAMLPQALFLAIVLPLGVYSVIKDREPLTKTVSLVATILTGFGLILAVFNMLPGKAGAPALVPLQTSWSVAVDSLKENPILGVGPGNYLTAFNRFRPISYNTTDLWATRFTAARNWPLTILTEAGLLGFAAFVLLAWRVFLMLKENFKQMDKKLDKANLNFVSLAVLSLLILLFPANTVVIVLLFLILTLNMKTTPFTIHLSAFMYGLDSTKPSKVIAYLVSIPAVVLVLALYFFGGRAVMAEYQFRQALNAATSNDGRLAYELLQGTIVKNPFVDRYRTIYAQVNLALAGNVASNENLTDEQRNLVTQLIQQAIREAKAAAALNITRSGNWEILARTYQGIIPFAQGSDVFAVQSFNQAIALDPYNPNLRIGLGGIYYAQGLYDDAIRIFELATIAKNDFANAHYNLALALKEKGETERAINEMKIVLSLTDPASADYELARTELEKLESSGSTTSDTETPQPESLTVPQEEPEPVIEPQLDLPEGAEPPSPSPTPLP